MFCIIDWSVNFFLFTWLPSTSSPSSVCLSVCPARPLWILVHPWHAIICDNAAAVDDDNDDLCDQVIVMIFWMTYFLSTCVDVIITIAVVVIIIVIIVILHQIKTDVCLWSQLYYYFSPILANLRSPHLLFLSANEKLAIRQSVRGLAGVIGQLERKICTNMVSPYLVLFHWLASSQSSSSSSA